MRHLITTFVYQEQDNNTPNCEVWQKVVDIEPSEVAKYEKVITDDFNSDYNGADIFVYVEPIIEDEWGLTAEFWR